MKHSNCRRSCSWLPPSVSSPGSRLSLPASRGPSPGPQQAQRLPPGFSSGFWSISGTQPGTAILDCTRGAGWGCHCGRPQLQPQPGLPQPPQSSDSFCTNLAILGGWARGPVCRRRQRGAVGGTLTPPARGLRFEEGTDTLSACHPLLLLLWVFLVCRGRLPAPLLLAASPLVSALGFPRPQEWGCSGSHLHLG